MVIDDTSREEMGMVEKEIVAETMAYCLHLGTIRAITHVRVRDVGLTTVMQEQIDRAHIIFTLQVRAFWEVLRAFKFLPRGRRGGSGEHRAVTPRRPQKPRDTYFSL